MKRIFLWLTALIIFQSGWLTPIFAADTNAVIPYKELKEIFQPISQVDQSKLEIRVFISSTNQAVPPSDIRLTIHSAKGAIPVALGTNGQVLQFPLDKNLLRENPAVLVNQPKGTVRLAVSVQLPMPDDLTFRYRRLGDGVAEMNKTIRTQAGAVLSLLAPKAQGVIFVFPKTGAGRAKVEIAAAAGGQELTADQRGQIKLKLDKSLLAENPEVKVSEKPVGIYPDLK